MLKGHTSYVTSICFDASGKYLASGGAMGVTCDGGGDVDNDGECDGERDDCGDYCGDDCGEHGDSCVRNMIHNVDCSEPVLIFCYGDDECGPTSYSL